MVELDAESSVIFRWLPEIEPAIVRLVRLAAVKALVSLAVSNPFAVTTMEPSPLLEPDVTELTEAVVPVFSASLVSRTSTVSADPASPLQ